MTTPSPLAAASPGTVSRIHLGLVSLSLDLTRDALAQLGLRVEDPDRFQRALRDACVAFWGEASPTPEAEQAFVAAAFRALGDALGEGFRARFEAWVFDVLVGDEGAKAQAFLWEQIVRFGGDDDARSRRPPPVVERLRLHLAARPIAAPERVPRTAWDIAVFDRYGYTKDPVDHPDERSPIPMLEGVSAYAMFREAWRAAVTASASAEADIEELVAWGVREAPALGMPTDLLGRPAFFDPSRDAGP